MNDLENHDTECSEGEDETEEVPVEDKGLDKQESDYYIWSTEDGSEDSHNDSAREEWTRDAGATESSDEIEEGYKNTEFGNNDVK